MLSVYEQVFIQLLGEKKNVTSSDCILEEYSEVV